LSRKAFGLSRWRPQSPAGKERPRAAVRFLLQLRRLAADPVQPLEDLQMAYDRYDTRDRPRDERSRWAEDRYDPRDRGTSHDRGFFERAGDEIASWFGDDDAERRRERDHRLEGSPDRDRGDGWRDRSWSNQRDRSWSNQRDRGYRPITGDYGRADHERTRGFDPHYRSWREKHMSELDRDYDEYARENQSRFESEFGSWRERRQQKRGLLSTIREHMEVIGNDDLHVGTVDRIAGDRIILAKSDPDSGGVHHSLSCSDIDRIEDDRVILDCSSEQARQRWRDESRSRALFEREDQGEMGPRMLDRSFEGTYR